MLAQNTILGNLKIIEVYEYLDGPRLFLAENENKQLFLVYWCDTNSNADGWLYLEISKDCLQQLKRKELTIRGAFSKKDLICYVVYTMFNPIFADSVEYFTLRNFELLPPYHFYLTN